MTTNLMKASHEWATRPADQRFASLREMLRATLVQAHNSTETTEVLDNCEIVVGSDGNLLLKTRHSGELAMSFWAFDQIARNIGSNARYMRQLVTGGKVEPERAAFNMNQDIARAGGDLGKSTLYIQNIGKPKLMSSTSTKYTRLYNHAMTSAIIDLGDDWRLLPARPARADDPNARPATAEDIGTSSRMQIGEPCVPSGAYASAQNAFIFVVNEKMALDDGMSGLKLGFFVENSEVGERAWVITTFLYREVCGNHIVWDASQIKTFRMKHMGDNLEGRMREQIRKQIELYANTDLKLAQDRIRKAMSMFIGNDLEEVSNNLFARKELKLTRGTIESAYEVGEQHVDTDGNPRTAWGFANALTRFSQFTPYQDERDAIDRSAARVLGLADISA